MCPMGEGHAARLPISHTCQIWSGEKLLSTIFTSDHIYALIIANDISTLWPVLVMTTGRDMLE